MERRREHDILDIASWMVFDSRGPRGPPRNLYRIISNLLSRPMSAELGFTVHICIRQSKVPRGQGRLVSGRGTGWAQAGVAY